MILLHLVFSSRLFETMSRKSAPNLLKCEEWKKQGGVARGTAADPRSSRFIRRLLRKKLLFFLGSTVTLLKEEVLSVLRVPLLEQV